MNLTVDKKLMVYAVIYGINFSKKIKAQLIKKNIVKTVAVLLCLIKRKDLTDNSEKTST